MPATVTAGTPPTPVSPSALAGRGRVATSGTTPPTAVSPTAASGGAVARVRGTTTATAPTAVAGRRVMIAKGTPPVAVMPPGAGTGRWVERYRGTFAAVNPVAFGGIPGQLIPDSVFLAAEAREERWPYGRVLIDWTGQDFTGPGADLSSVVTSVEVERSRSGELPETAGMPDGYDSATAKVQLQGTREGASMTIAGELSPYRTDRPRYGSDDDVTAPAIVDMGLITDDGRRHYRQFTGPLRTIAVNEGTERAALSLVDPNEDIRELVTLPTYGEFASHAKRRPWALTVNTQWLVDWVLRRNGIYCSPKARADAIVSCTGHGGLVAEVGYNDAPISINLANPPQAGLWTDDDHPWGMLGTPEAADKNGTLGYQQFYGITDGINAPVRFQSGYGVGVSGWLHAGSWMTGTSDAAYENRIWHVRPTVNDYPRLFVNGFPNGELYAGISIDANTIISTPRFRAGSRRWNHHGFHWRWVSNTRCELRVRINGTVTTYTLDHAAISVVPTPFYDGYKATTELRGHLFRSWTNLQMWPGYTPPTVAEWQALENHVSEADVGRGLNELLYLPDMASKDSWELLKAVVSAEFGVHGFSPEGRYSFRPRSDSYSGDPEVDISVETNLAEVAYSISSDSVRNVVGYSVTPKYHATDGKGARSESVVVSAQDVLQFTVPAGKRYTYEVDWPWGATGWRGGVLPYHRQKDSAPSGFPEWGADVVHGWTYSTRGASGNWTIVDNVQSVVVRYCQTSARRALVIVDNTDPSCTKDIRLATAQPADASSDGEPALRIGGWPLKDQPAHVESFRNQDSIDRHRGQARGLDIATSEFRQTPGVLDPVCQALLVAMADAIPVLEDLPVRGNPRVQVGQVARLTFRGDSTAPVIGTIVKTNRALDADGLHDKVSVRPLPLQTLAPSGWTFFVDISRYQGDRADPLQLQRLKDLGYAGCIAKVGQGAGVTMTGTVYGQSIDPWWTSWRDQSKTLWPTTTAGYWYVGNTETPASQASRCKAAMGDLTLPVMLDWEDAGGDFANLTAVLAAFRSAGLKVTMLYCGSGYVQNTKAASAGPPATGSGGGNPSNIDAATGLKVIRARYWTNDQDHPRRLFDDITDPRAFGLAAFNGATPDAFQFTQYGVVYSGMAIDVDAAPVSTVAQLSDLFYNRA